MLSEINKYKRTKFAAYFAYVAGASVFSLPPLLFVTFHEMYNVSYTLLGTLVLTNFCTQLLIDLIFTFFSKHFNIHKTIRTMPLITALGIAIYAVVPNLFPQFAYLGLLIGTIIFSVAAGLGEVLLSPLVAAIPSETPEKDMSRLHSLYGYGVVFVITISTIFFKIFGANNWMYLAIFFAVLPIISSILFFASPLPNMDVSSNNTEKGKNRRGFGIALCVLCIFLGSAAENTMTNWISGFAESALHISKTVGDILGFMVFAILLAVCRSIYAKIGGNISNVLLIGMIGATACYLVAGFSTSPILSLIACVLTGFATSMLWPGTLIFMEENIPGVGVTAYALMAAGGDFGASVAPQIMGIVVDKVSVSEWANGISGVLNLSTEQIGMKTGMLISVLFPLLGTFLLLYIRKYFKKKI